MQLKAAAGKALLMVFGIILFVGIAEVGLRIWTPVSISYKGGRQFDPIYNHSLKPTTRHIQKEQEFEVEIKTNSLGMRGNEYVPLNGKEFRIAALGDSYTMGSGVPVESCFVNRLEARLNERTEDSTRYVVFNFGVSGYSPIIEYLVLVNKVLPLHPDIVMICYDMSDVVEDFSYAEDAVFDSRGRPVRINPTMPDVGDVNWFPRGKVQTFYQEHSYLYALLRPFINKLKPLPLYEPGNIHAGKYMHTVDSSGVRWDKYFQQSESYIKLMSDTCKARSIRFILSVHPTGNQVSEQEWAEGRKYWSLESKVYNSVIFKSLENFSLHEEIPIINMTGTFRRKSKGDLFYAIDGHFTTAGHRVASDTLFQFLVGRGFVPGDAAIHPDRLDENRTQE